MIFEWQRNIWQGLVERSDRLPHALLFTGPAGSGKTQFAQTFAARILCETPDSEGFACGKCQACGWRKSGNHPDFLLITPESAQAIEEVETENGEGGLAKGKKRSDQIRIEQIRALASLLNVGAHRQGYRVVIIQPAEAMNTSTANALLKLLEEPPSSTLFILITNSYHNLLPTVLSRCQAVRFPKPDEERALRWLETEGIKNADLLLAFAGGMPLAAASLASGGAAQHFAHFLSGLQTSSATNALRLAAQWESWLRESKDESAKTTDQIDMPGLITWLQKWVFDLLMVKLMGTPKFFPGMKNELKALCDHASISALFACYNDIQRARAVARHPLNPRLLLEDLALRYARAVAG